MIENYLDSVKKQLLYYKMLGEKTFSQLDDDALFWQFNAESNSIDVIVKHLSGNMLSRWTDFLTSDGEKEWRNREDEFEATIKTREELVAAWEKGWNCVFDALDSVNKDNFDTVIYIRNMGHSMSEAINRQLAHYAYHIGQIVYIGRMINGDKWLSLSVPKGGSAAFNAEKFSKEKRRAHFTDDLMDNDEK